MEESRKPLILIVDDEFANIYFLNRVLKGEGYLTESAESGSVALEKLESIRPDAILLDIMMPEMTGLEVIEKIKADDRLKNIPVIIVSAKSESTDVDNALNLGAVEYIRKPVDEIELLARLRTAIRIREYQMLLEESVKSKDEFIRMVAHDLRTPFTTISGFAELLKNDEQLGTVYTAEQKEFLNFIYTSSSFMVSYFNKLLNWAKVGMRNLTLDKKWTELKSLLNTSLLIFKAKAEEKNIQLDDNIKAGIQILADEVYFSQVLSNLLGNAIKYTPSGGKITLNFYSASTNQGVITIEDTGCGIPDDIIHLITSEHPIKSSPGTDGEKGTGLGLKICHKIVINHGCKLEIQRPSYGGTKVSIVIPLQYINL